MARILLVEDDADQLELRRMILEGLGYEVSPAATVEEALAAAESGKPEAVVMDLRLPRREDGVALLGRLAGGAPVIVLTGASGEAAPPGAFRVLGKPCPTRMLVRAIEEATGADGAANSRGAEERAH